MDLQAFTGSHKLGRIEIFHDLWYHYSLRDRRFARYQPSWMKWSIHEFYKNILFDVSHSINFYPWSL